MVWVMREMFMMQVVSGGKQPKECGSLLLYVGDWQSCNYTVKSRFLSLHNICALDKSSFLKYYLEQLKFTFARFIYLNNVWVRSNEMKDYKSNVRPTSVA